MTNWQDPVRVATDYLALVKLIHVMAGILIWEFVINLPFDVSVITGKRKFRWTFVLYMGCRWWPILCISIMLLGFDVNRKIDCDGWVVSVFCFAYLSFIFASALIVLRIAAIWERNKLAVGLAVVAWLTNTGSYLHSTITVRAVFSPVGSFCAVQHTEHSKINILVTLVTDFVLLGLMLGGLMRWSSARSAGGGIWRLLYNQGLVWLLVVSLAEIPPTVLIILNLNDPLNLMFQVPELIIMALGAARIYRGLADYSALHGLRTSDKASARPSERFMSAPSSGGEQGPGIGAVYVMNNLPRHGAEAYGGDKSTKFDEDTYA
ncbi:hypothetical protein BC834DRAFT_658640 [Gloeopeniophorella convolvens]|nr:hypothetical protein BC834DRAFT_658640 [Gloeopeniophorella convolvens]